MFTFFKKIEFSYIIYIFARYIYNMNEIVKNPEITKLVYTLCLTSLHGGKPINRTDICCR
jgi:hypothetical protein